MLDVLLEIEGAACFLFEGFCMQYLFSAFAKPKVRQKIVERYAGVAEGNTVRHLQQVPCGA